MPAVAAVAFLKHWESWRFTWLLGCLDYDDQRTCDFAEWRRSPSFCRVGESDVGDRKSESTDGNSSGVVVVFIFIFAFMQSSRLCGHYK